MARVLSEVLQSGMEAAMGYTGATGCGAVGATSYGIQS